MNRVTAEEYEQATENYTGWCPDCQAFTRDSTEPDAEEYDCTSCEGRSVMGAEQALLTGAIEVEPGRCSSRGRRPHDR